MKGLLIAAIVIKVLVWLVLWGLGYLALVVMIGLPFSGWQVGGGALVLAIITPVRLEQQGPRW